jgi:hypothetical protein
MRCEYNEMRCEYNEMRCEYNVMKCEYLEAGVWRLPASAVVLHLHRCGHA